MSFYFFFVVVVVAFSGLHFLNCIIKSIELLRDAFTHLISASVFHAYLGTFVNKLQCRECMQKWDVATLIKFRKLSLRVLRYSTYFYMSMLQLSVLQKQTLLGCVGSDGVQPTTALVSVAAAHEYTFGWPT